MLLPRPFCVKAVLYGTSSSRRDADIAWTRALTARAYVLVAVTYKGISTVVPVTEMASLAPGVAT